MISPKICFLLILLSERIISFEITRCYPRKLYSCASSTMKLNAKPLNIIEEAAENYQLIGMNQREFSSER